MSWRPCRGDPFFASPGRWKCTCWSWWSYLNCTKSGWWMWVLGRDKI